MNWNTSFSSGLNSGSVVNSHRVSGSSTAADGYQELVNGIRQQSRENNLWSAEQAERQMRYQTESQRKAMDFNAAEAAKNRDWQKMMSDTAHQREVRDLMKAGLNPVLSVNGGNGASVGSGATAGSVGAGSGSKGDTDTSANSAIVSLLSAVLNRKTQLEIADTNAKTNLAVAEKYNAISKYLGELQNSTSLYLGEKGLSNSLAVAGIQAASAANVAGIHAAAQKYSADQSRQASIYVANVQSRTSQIVAEINKSSHIVGQQISAQASRYASDVSAAARRYESDASIANAQKLQRAQQQFENYVKKHYPSNVWEAIAGQTAVVRDRLLYGDAFRGDPSAAGGFGGSR